MNRQELELILNVDKPVGPTSYDVVRMVKRILKGTKVGHGGTLDPFAEGVLLILVGGATKQMADLLALPKTYEGRLRLGEKTDSGDCRTAVVNKVSVPHISPNMLAHVTQKFSGEIEQIPPKYSAKKIRGVPAYKYARRGLDIQLAPVRVNIHRLQIQKVADRMLELQVTCSSGTYIRTLGEDIARQLGTVGHLTQLCRTRIGPYTRDRAIPLARLQEQLLESVNLQVSEV